LGLVGLGLCRKILGCVGSFYTELNAKEWVQLNFTHPVPSVVYYRVTFTLTLMLF